MIEAAFIHNQAPSWGPYKFFPFWHIESSTGHEESATDILESEEDEHRVILWMQDRQVIRVGDMTMTPEAHRELRAFRRLIGSMEKLFFMRDSREYRAGRWHKGELLSGEWLGDGDGTQTEFQLRLHAFIQGLPVLRNIYFPNHGYPDLKDMYGRVRHETEYIRVFVAGVEVFNWTIERLTGKLIFAQAPTGRVTWGGTFFNLMRCNQATITTEWRNGNFVIDSGIELIEPKGATPTTMGEGIEPEEIGSQVAGIKATYFVDSASPENKVLTRIEPHIALVENGVPPEAGQNFTVHWQGIFRPDRSGNLHMRLQMVRRFRIWIDDELVMSRWTVEETGGPFWFWYFDTHNIFYTFEKGREYQFRMEWSNDLTGFPIHGGGYWIRCTLLLGNADGVFGAMPFTTAALDDTYEEWVDARAPAKWGRYRILPWWMTETESGGEEAEVPIYGEGGSEVRGEATESRQLMTIRNMNMTGDEHRFIRDWRRLHRGAGKPFLARDIREYKGGSVDAWSNAVASREFLGVGDGATTDFGLRLRTEYQGEDVDRSIYFPDHGYPALLDEAGNVKHPTQYIRVWVDGVERVAGWQVNRVRSGMIRFTDNIPLAGQAVEAVFSFYNLMRFRNDYISTSPNGRFFKTEGANELIEPRGRR